METLRGKAIICDIEGTTTSISFVKDILFPFSKKHLRQFLTSNKDNPEVYEVFKEIQKLPDYKESYHESINEVSIEKVSQFFDLMVNDDKKIGIIKTLQGFIWQKGFEDNILKGHIYPDVPESFLKWTQNGIKIFIYSSGSVGAQKNLFKYSEAGDLLKYISGNFDTQIGHKQEVESYENILKEIRFSAEDVIFFTDIVKEAEASTKCGIKSVLLNRPGNALITEMESKHFKVIKSFNDINVLL